MRRAFVTALHRDRWEDPFSLSGINAAGSTGAMH